MSMPVVELLDERQRRERNHASSARGELDYLTRF